MAQIPRLFSRFKRILAAAGLVTLFHSPEVVGAPSNFQQLFDEGKKLREAGDCDGAIQLFTRSNALRGSVGALTNIAECHELGGRLLEAERFYETALELALRIRSRWRDDVRTAKEKLKTSIPTLTLRVASTFPKDAVVLLNGKPIDASLLNFPMRMDPGTYSLAVTCSKQTRNDQVVLMRSEKKTVEVVAPAASVDETPAAVDRTYAYLATAIGLTGIGVAVVSGLIINNKRDIVRANCDSNTNTCSNSEGLEASEAVKTWLPINTVGWLVGGVGLAAGTVLYVTAHPSSSNGSANLNLVGRF